MSTLEIEEEILFIIKPLYELLDSFGVQKFRTDSKGTEFHKDWKIFGYLDHERLLHLRIKPLASGSYPEDSVMYEGQMYKKIKLQPSFDKEYILEEIQQAIAVSSSET